jgi:hypothetical protein
VSDERQERCERCKFWDRSKLPDDANVGVCRRHAPAPRTILHHDDDDNSFCLKEWPVWPQTLGSEWCGEFQAPTLPANGLALEDLGLSQRAFGCLWREGVRTAEQLTRLFPDDLLDMRNLGAGTLAEVRQALARHGLTLREQ